MRVSPACLASWLGFGALIGFGCTGPYATTTDGVETTTDSGGCPIGGEGCPCTPGGTCDGSLVCASKFCVSIDDTSTGGTTTDAPTTSVTDTDPTAGECAPANEQESDDCAGAEPYCALTGECVSCVGISSCAAVDPGKPACDADSGLCVVCTDTDASGCGGTTPICDAEGMTCRACTQHSDCTGSACDIKTGACFPAAQALWVDGAGSCDDGGEGSEGAPLCTIAAALARVEADALQAILVRGATYDEALAVPAGGVVALVRAGIKTVAITAVGAEALRIDAGARVYLDRLDIRGNTEGSGIGCDGAELWVDRSQVREHQLSGVSGSGCDIQVRASSVTQNISEGIALMGGQLALENAFVTRNGDKGKADYPRGGIALAGGAAASLVYSTMVGNAAFIGGGSTIDCDPDAADEKVTMRNSIAFNLSGYSTFNCEGAEVVQHSAISALSDDPNDDNVGVNTTDSIAVMTADPVVPGVYRPKLGTVLEEVASFVSGDPELDFEGHPRPPEGLSFPGADHPHR